MSRSRLGLVFVILAALLCALGVVRTPSLSPPSDFRPVATPIDEPSPISLPLGSRNDPSFEIVDSVRHLSVRLGRPPGSDPICRTFPVRGPSQDDLLSLARQRDAPSVLVEWLADSSSGSPPRHALSALSTVSDPLWKPLAQVLAEIQASSVSPDPIGHLRVADAASAALAEAPAATYAPMMAAMAVNGYLAAGNRADAIDLTRALLGNASPSVAEAAALALLCGGQELALSPDDLLRIEELLDADVAHLGLALAPSWAASGDIAHARVALDGATTYMAHARARGECDPIRDADVSHLGVKAEAVIGPDRDCEALLDQVAAQLASLPAPEGADEAWAITTHRGLATCAKVADCGARGVGKHVPDGWSWRWRAGNSELRACVEQHASAVKVNTTEEVMVIVTTPSCGAP